MQNREEKILNNTYTLSNELFAQEAVNTLKELRNIYRGQLNAEQKIATMADVFDNYNENQMYNSITACIMFVVATEGNMTAENIPNSLMPVFRSIHREGEEFFSHLMKVSTQSAPTDMHDVSEVLKSDEKVYRFVDKLTKEIELS